MSARLDGASATSQMSPSSTVTSIWGIVAEPEIEKIAQFLSEIDTNSEIDYPINRFRGS